MDYRLNKKYTEQERLIHEDLLEIVKTEGATSVQKALRRIERPGNLKALQNVLQHLFQLSQTVAESAIAKAKKVWRKQR